MSRFTSPIFNGGIPQIFDDRLQHFPICRKIWLSSVSDLANAVKEEASNIMERR